MSLAANLIPYASLFQRMIPREILPLINRWSANVLAYIQKERKKIVKKNLEMIGVRASEKLVKDTIWNWTLCISHQLQSLWMNPEELAGMVTDCGGTQRITETLGQGLGAILVTAHLGNYELAGSYLALQGFPVYSVVEEISGGHTRAVNRVRRRFGMGVLSYSDVPGMFEVLRRGKILVLVADRDLEGKGLLVDFGRSLRRVPVGPALLSLRTGVPVQTGYFVLNETKRGYDFYMNRFTTPPIAGNLGEKTRHLTVKITDQLVRMIGCFPDQWFCFQDDWQGPHQKKS